MKKILVGIVLFVVMSTVAWATPISVSLEASSNSVFVGDIFTIDILADIPDPVLGWGLDLNFDSGLVSQSTAPVVVGDSWLSLSTTMDDGLAGLAFPDPVSGVNVLLATLTFEANAAGFATFAAGYSPLDKTEGFPLALSLPGSFADVSFTNTLVTINNAEVPEPNPLLLFGIGFAVFGVTRWRNNYV